MVSAAVLINSTNIAVKLDEVVTAASVNNIENWVLFGTPIITSVKLQDDGQTVLVTVDKPVTTKVKIFAQEIYDLKDNVMFMFTSVKLVNVVASDVGAKNASGVFTDPAIAGKTIALSESDYIMSAGGSDIWGTSDGMHFAYCQINGDFDATVRVVSMTQADVWSKCVLMVREDLDGGSRSVQVLTTPPGGQNLIAAQGRPTKGGSATDSGYGGSVSGVPYPNAWLRIVRAGNTFTCYWGNNGKDWTKLTDVVPTTAFPSSVYVGMGATAHNNSSSIVAKFSDFKITGPNVTPLNIVPNSTPVLSWPIGDDQLIESLAPTR
jgi:regulation of enolase protein 1 (concanavalin A-like superfamily)